MIRTAWSDQVPRVIEAYVTLLMAQAMNVTDENERGLVLRRVKDKFAIHHLPRIEDFQAAFVSKRANPAEIKLDEASQRFYLVGIGMPGREEFTVEKRPVKDRYGNTQFYEQETRSEVKDDTILSYTEVSLRDVRSAEERAAEMPEHVKEALCQFFGITPHHLIAALLALPSYRDEDLYGIASYAIQNG